MIKFFSRIRKKLLTENPPSGRAGRFSRYLLYAIGEIVLVVIGILIALQINNWNIDESQQEKIKEYAKSYIQDLEADILMAKTNWQHINNVSDKIDSLSQAVQNKKIEEISNIDFMCMTWKILYRPYNWNRSTIDQMKNSGSLQFVKDASIAKKIGDYDAFTYHLDGDYLNDKAKSENSIHLISQVVNSNYSNMKALRKNVLMKINNPEVKDFHLYTDSVYLESKAYNLKLITNDKNDIDKAMNSLIRLQSYYDIRTGIELPQLTDDAEELITLLKDTYLD